jgi:hypothetical protein
MYEQRLCAFVDILGFSDLIERSLKQSPLQQKIRQLLREVIDAKPIWKQDSSIDLIEARLIAQGVPNPRSEAEQTAACYAVAERGTSFSDSLVLSVTLDPHAIRGLVTSLILLSRSLAELGGYVRGGVSNGLLCHEENMCFGPAHIAAYKMEKCVACYPRIVVAPNAHEAITAVDTDIADPLSSYFRTDSDGKIYLNFLTPQVFGQFNSFLHEEQMWSISKELSRQLLRVQPTNPARPKLIWLARYFNSVLREAPISCMKSIFIGS